MSKQNEEMSSHITLESTDLFNSESPNKEREEEEKKHNDTTAEEVLRAFDSYKIRELY